MLAGVLTCTLKRVADATWLSFANVAIASACSSCRHNQWGVIVLQHGAHMTYSAVQRYQVHETNGYTMQEW